jgi:hypothetical protein
MGQKQKKQTNKTAKRRGGGVKTVKPLFGLGKEYKCIDENGDDRWGVFLGVREKLNKCNPDSTPPPKTTTPTPIPTTIGHQPPKSSWNPLNWWGSSVKGGRRTRKYKKRV